MKKIKCIRVTFAKDNGKETIMYESVQEMLDYFPNVDEGHVGVLKDILDNGEGQGIVKMFAHTDDNPLFIQVSDKDEYEILD